ncbi:MAG: helix-turn-helix transcriptional regulator [Dongiaceae bacterium]
MDNILPIALMSPAEILTMVAARCRQRRLAFGHSRDQLAARSGVTAASLKRFERTGNISFDGLVKLAIALDALDGVDLLFAKKVYGNLDEILETAPPRQRGGRSRKPT